MRVRRSLHLTTAALVASGALLAISSQAAEAKTFYLRMEGCGATAEPGRLDTKKGTDGAHGCGIIGGLPLEEVIHVVEPASSTVHTYDTGTAGIPLTLGSGKITGTMTAGSWHDAGTGGVGMVTFDLALTGVTSKDAKVDFGTVTVTGSAAPADDTTEVPFEIEVPGSASGQTFKKFSFSVSQRGLNFPMSAQALEGASFIVFPQQ